MTSFKIDLNTGNRFWTPKGLGSLGMDPNRAIAELIANSLDWRREKATNFTPIIKVKITKTSIEVLDNGVGMNISELQNAIQVSVANDNLRPSLRIRKGMFGMGMKVACLSLGWKIHIQTRSLSKPNEENLFVLNSRNLDDDGTSNKYRKEISGESTGWMKDSPLGKWESGTYIRIEDLTHKNLTAITVRDSLQEVFAPEINVENASIEVVDAEGKSHFCQKITVPIYEPSKINLDALNLFVNDPDTNDLIPIKGWLALMKSGSSGTGKWGIHLFKNNQIIERFHQLPIRLGGLMPKNPHPSYGRTYGEIHLDMCKPAFHKVGFDYSTENWHTAQNLLSDHIKKIMDASYDFRVGDYEKAQKTIKAIQKQKRAVRKTLKKIKQTERLTELDNTIVLPTGELLTLVKPIFNILGENEKTKPWIYHYRKKSKEVAIIINKESAVYQNLVEPKLNDDSIELLVAWAVSDSVMFLLHHDFNYKLHDAVSFRDDQLIKLTSNISIQNA